MYCLKPTYFPTDFGANQDIPSTDILVPFSLKHVSDDHKNTNVIYMSI